MKQLRGQSSRKEVVVQTLTAGVLKVACYLASDVIQPRVMNYESLVDRERTDVLTSTLKAT